MTNKPEGAGSRACWFVGATYGSDDQTSRFLKDSHVAELLEVEFAFFLEEFFHAPFEFKKSCL